MKPAPQTVEEETQLHARTQPKRSLSQLEKHFCIAKTTDVVDLHKKRNKNIKNKQQGKTWQNKSKANEEKKEETFNSQVLGGFTLGAALHRREPLVGVVR